MLSAVYIYIDSVMYLTYISNISVSRHIAEYTVFITTTTTGPYEYFAAK